MHEYFVKNIPPTVNSVFKVVSGDSDLPNLKRLTSHVFLKKISFKFGKRGNKALLLERGT